MRAVAKISITLTFVVCHVMILRAVRYEYDRECCVYGSAWNYCIYVPGSYVAVVFLCVRV